MLMDVQMPEMDGLEATGVIRRLEEEGGLPLQKPERIPIIAMTAHALKGDQERCLEAGMDGYVSKPMRVHQLFAAIEEFFGESGGSSDHPDAEQPAVDSSMVDWPAAMAAVQQDVELLKSVVEAFLEECDAQRKSLEEAIQTGNSAEVQRVAHLMKGAMSLFGASKAVEQAERIEAAGRSGQLGGTAAAFDALCESLKALVTLLKDFVAAPERYVETAG